MTITAKQILADLEVSEPYRFFFDLGHIYQYLIGCRLHLFADQTKWAVVCEKYSYSNRSTQITADLFHYGNCLHSLSRAGATKQFACNMKTITLVDFNEMRRIQSSLGRIRSNASEMQFRDEKLPIYRTPSDYHHFGIVNEDFDNLKVVPYARLLFAMHREKFYATEKELRTCIPDTLPCILSLDQWHHRDFGIYRNRVIGELPSAYETYPMLAEVLVLRDASLYQPTLAPNTSWEHWPQSGSH